MMPRSRIPWIVLSVSLLLTIIATWALADSVIEQDEVRLVNAIRGTRNDIEARIETYVAVLRGLAGLYAASDEGVTLQEFKNYTYRLRIRQRYPGIQGIGYADRFRPQERDSLIRAMHRQGVPDFHIWPESSDSERTAIIYLEPQDRRNQAAIGFDMFSEKVRREAMARARDTGSSALSGKVTLVQEISGRKQAGFLIYTPVYRGSGDPGTLARRRQRLDGYVYAPFRADDLFAGIFGREERPLLAFRIYEGTQVNPENLLHDSRMVGIVPARGKGYNHSEVMHISGHTWTVTLAPTAYLEAESRYLLVILIALIGVALSLTLFLLSRVQLQALNAAHEQAARMAAEAREEQLRIHTVELERSNRELRDFTYIASHDLQEPLRKISTFADLLYVEYGKHLDDEGRHYLLRMKHAAINMSRLLKDLLAFSLIQAKAKPFQRVDLNATMTDVLADLEIQSRRVQAQFDVAQIPEVEADPAQIRQLLYQLVDNALKFHQPGVPPLIRVSGTIEKGHLDHLPEETTVCRIDIQDNGIGFEEKYLDRIFTPFQQLNDHGQYEGTGIGLSICRRIVERHGGIITARSAPGEGSTFTVKLPLEHPESKALQST